MDGYKIMTQPPSLGFQVLPKAVCGQSGKGSAERDTLHVLKLIWI